MIDPGSSARIPEASPRRLGFGRVLAIIVALGLAARLAYVLTVGSDLELGYDALWYVLQSGTISSGLGYIDPDAFYQQLLGVPTANFPPLWPLALAGANLLGVDAQPGTQMVGVVFGTATVGLTGLLGRRIAGPRVGLVAALIVALGPMLIAADGSLMSESLYVALVTAVMLLAYRALDRPTVLRFSLVGVLLGVAALARADALFLVPILTVALVWRVSGQPPGRRLLLGGGMVASVLVVLAPWTIYSSARMGGFVAMSSNSGLVLEGANCPSAYNGPLLGAWDEDCIRPRDRDVPELDWAAESRQIGTDYALSEPTRIPIVGAARFARLFGLWSPVDQARLESIETRDERWQLLGWGYAIVVLALAVPGTVLLVRQRAELTPVIALVGAVVVTAVVSYGNQRARLTIDPVLAIAAGAALLGARGVLRSGRPCPAPGRSSEAHDTNEGTALPTTFGPH